MLRNLRSLSCPSQADRDQQTLIPWCARTDRSQLLNAAVDVFGVWHSRRTWRPPGPAHRALGDAEAPISLAITRVSGVGRRVRRDRRGTVYRCKEDVIGPVALTPSRQHADSKWSATSSTGTFRYVEVQALLDRLSRSKWRCRWPKRSGLTHSDGVSRALNSSGRLRGRRTGRDARCPARLRIASLGDSSAGDAKVRTASIGGSSALH